MRQIVAVAGVLASAVLYGASFPPNAQRFLAWIALVPLLVVLRRATLWQGISLTFLWSVAMAYRVNDWFAGSVAGYFQQPLAIGITLFLGVTTIGAALQYSAFAAVHHHIIRLRTRAIPWLVAAAWVGADLMRVKLFGGDPWAILGYSQVGVLPIMQLADVAGVHGITFLVVLTNAVAANLLSPAHTGRRLAVHARMLSVLVLALLLVVLYGTYRIRSVTEVAARRSPVGVVQAHLPLGSQWQRSFYGRNLDKYLAMSLDVLRERRPRLLVWPENAMTFFIADEPAYRRAMGALLAPFGTELITGGPYAVGEDPKYFNSAFLLSAGGEILGRYDKQELLPFAEYFPFGRSPFLQQRFGRIRAFTPGDDTPLLSTGVGQVGVVICNEGFFPEPASIRARAGAELLVNLSNDSWLGVPKFSEPAFDMVTLRAVEQRRWIVRASTAGPSALIDPVGRVLQRTNLFTAAALAGTVEARSGLTPYGRFGDVFAWACGAVAWIAAVAGLRQSRRPRNVQGATSHEATAGAVSGTPGAFVSPADESTGTPTRL